MDLSIITSCRNKDYGGDVSVGGRIFKTSVDFIGRFKRAIEEDLARFDQAGIDYEWIVVDWASPGIPMHKVPELAEIFAHPRVRNIVVGEDVAVAEGLDPPTGFYEHFAKNVGIRSAVGAYVLIVNGDIILSSELVGAVAQAARSQDHGHFFRPRWHVDIHPETNEIIRKVDLADKANYDCVVAANYGGNFLLAAKDVLVNVAEGFDETNPKHRSEYWHRSGMDGEILWQMHHKGVRLKHLEAGYEHIFHGKPPEGMEYNMDGYVNKPHWGFVTYPRTTEGSVMRITADG